jgi:hypothetical protein
MGALVRFSVDRRWATLAVAVVLGAGGGSWLGLLTTPGVAPAAPTTSAVHATGRPTKKPAGKAFEGVSSTRVRRAAVPTTTAPPTTTTRPPTTTSTTAPPTTTSTTEPASTTSSTEPASSTPDSSTSSTVPGA